MCIYIYTKYSFYVLLFYQYRNVSKRNFFLQGLVKYCWIGLGWMVQRAAVNG